MLNYLTMNHFMTCPRSYPLPQTGSSLVKGFLNGLGVERYGTTIKVNSVTPTRHPKFSITSEHLWKKSRISCCATLHVSFLWATVEHFDISAILDRIEEVLNSNQFFFLDLGVTIRLHHIVNPAGGRARKFDGLPEQ